MSSKKHRAGKKYSKNHSTVIAESLPLLDFLEGEEGIKKISLGAIINAGSPGSPLRIGVRPLPQDVHGMRINISKGALNQKIRIYLAAEASFEIYKEKIEAFGDHKTQKRGKHTRKQKKRRPSH